MYITHIRQLLAAVFVTTLTLNMTESKPSALAHAFGIQGYYRLESSCAWKDMSESRQSTLIHVVFSNYLQIANSSFF